MYARVQCKIPDLKRRWLSVAVCLLLAVLCASCVTHVPQHVSETGIVLPAPVRMNRGAGQGDLLYLTLRMNGKRDLLFVVDTGTSMTGVDISLQYELGAPSGNFALHDNIASTTQTNGHVYTAPELSLGKTRLVTGPQVFVSDFQAIRELVGKPVMGILGMDCLRNYCLQLDFKNRWLTFVDPDNPPAQNNAPVYSLLEGHDGLPALNQKTFGSWQNLFVIDTGDTGDGGIDDATFEKATAAVAVRSATGLGATFSGLSRRQSVRVSRFQLGQEHFSNLIFTRQGVNSIGLQLLARYNVLLNFPKNQISLQRRPGPFLPDEISMTGCHHLRRNGRTVVYAVDPDSPAAAAGIRPNDEIIRINNRSASSYEMWQIDALLTSGDGNIVKLKLRRDKKIFPVSLTLKRRI